MKIKILDMPFYYCRTLDMSSNITELSIRILEWKYNFFHAEMNYEKQKLNNAISGADDVGTNSVQPNSPPLSASLSAELPSIRLSSMPLSCPSPAVLAAVVSRCGPIRTSTRPCAARRRCALSPSKV